MLAAERESVSPERSPGVGSMAFDLQLFSFTGRCGRFGYWSVGLVQVVLAVAVVAVLLGSTGSLRAIAEGTPLAAMSGATVTVAVVGGMLFVWIGLAATVRRWHDRGKSGWWCLVGVVPVLGPVWLLVELGFLGSVDAGNRFGPGGPRGVGADDPEPAGGLDPDRVVAEWRAKSERDHARPGPAPAAARAGTASLVSRSTPAGFGRRGLTS